MKQQQYLDDIQFKVKKTSIVVITFAFRLAIGFTLGFLFALIGQGFSRYGFFTFTFVVLISTGVFFRISKNWTIIGLCIFSIIFVLASSLLRMYIMIAPGK